MTAHVDLRPRVERKDDQLACGVPGDGDTTGARRHVEDPGHPARHALDAAADVHHRDRQARLLPEHDVVLEEHRVARGQSQLRHRDDCAVDLTGRVGETETGEIPELGHLGPAGIGDLVLLVERGTTRGAGGLSRLALGLAPLALDQVHDPVLLSGPRTGGGRRECRRRCRCRCRCRFRSPAHGSVGALATRPQCRRNHKSVLPAGARLGSWRTALASWSRRSHRTSLRRGPGRGNSGTRRWTVPPAGRQRVGAPAGAVPGGAAVGAAAATGYPAAPTGAPAKFGASGV